MKRSFLIGMAALALSANLPATESFQWDDYENRSLEFPMVENEVILESAQAHDNLQIQITSADGTIYYLETVSVPAGTYVISVADLPAGEYCLQLTTEENWVKEFLFIKTID